MSSTIPPSKITNVLDATKNSSGLADLDISDSLGLADVISVRYTQIPCGNQREYSVEEKRSLICYILTGDGQIKKGDRTADLASSDCFSFAQSETASSFTLVGGQSLMTVLVVSDVWSDQEIPSGALPEFPTIISAEKTAAWRNKGIDSTKAVRLAKNTDMAVKGNPPWGLTLERIPPGCQSSNAHAHSVEDEFCLILAGKARYWHQGESPERILVPGDAVGWKAGTGVCHSLLNDAEDENGAGEDLVFLVWGGDTEEDKLHYAAANPPWWTDKNRWRDCPIHPIEPASSLPRHPRPEDRPSPRYADLMRNLSRHARYYATKPIAITDSSPQLKKRQTFPELSNLAPLPPKTVKHVSLKRTEPASASRLVFGAPAPGGVLQPDYTLIRRYAQCPTINNKIFGVKLIPHELLSHLEPSELPPFPPSPSPHFSKFGPEGDKIRYRSMMNKSGTIYASMLFVPSKAKVHNHAVKRRTVGRRIREAMKLIVIRGARSSDDGNSIVFDPKDAGEEKWLVKGWSYIFFPSLEAYRAPWPSLITTVRESLKKLKVDASKLSDRPVHSRPLNFQNEGGGSNGRPAPSRDPSSTSRRAASGRNTPPSSRSYSTAVNRREGTRPRKVDMRAEVILGTHAYASFWEIEEVMQAEPLGSSHQVASQQIVYPDVEEIQSIWENETYNFRDESDVGYSYVDTYDEDAEGWVVAGDRLPADGNDLGIPHLLDSFNAPRFYHPHLPPHAGRGYERNMRTVWKDESKEAIRAKFEKAAVERRKKRKVLRERWNQVSIEWIDVLRRREEKRLENMYGWTLRQERNRGTPNKPWWAPGVGDLGWDERAKIEAQNSDLDPAGGSAGVDTPEDNAPGPDDFNSVQFIKEESQRGGYH